MVLQLSFFIAEVLFARIGCSLAVSLLSKPNRGGTAFLRDAQRPNLVHRAAQVAKHFPG